MGAVYYNYINKKFITLFNHSKMIEKTKTMKSNLIDPPSEVFLMPETLKIKSRVKNYLNHSGSTQDSKMKNIFTLPNIKKVSNSPFLNEKQKCLIH